MNRLSLKRINSFKISNMVVTLLMFFVMCLDSIRDVEAGGKGKVPIYMPIPIPIPMPMGPPGGGGKYHHHHHHQQQHRGDDGGEVKKIYLLQPAPRMQPQPHLKGGGFMGGPVQTHIHMTPLGRQSSNNNQNQQQQTYHEGDQAEQPGSGRHRSKSSSHSHDSMKILPIVVIPPIAPMPPIQLPSSNSIQGARMTLTPQFNNYLVTPASTDLGDKSGRHRITLLQDHKSFSDYGLGNSGGGSGSHYRDNYAARSRLRGRQALRSALSDYDGTGSSRVRYSRSQDELGDDYDMPSTWRVSPRNPSNRLAASRRIALLHNASRLRANSIRDILDQQALFDDEPSSVIDELRDTINDARLTSGSSSTTCCGALDERRPTRYSEVPTSADNIYAADTNLDQREPADINLNNYQRQSSSSASSKVRQYDSLAPSLIERAIQDEEADKPAVFRQKDSLYYDRDPLDPPTGGRLAASSYRYNHHPSADSFSSGSNNNNKRLHPDERDLLDDYEWRFDSIKSVAHASPQVVKSNGTDTSSSKNMTTISRDAS